MTDLSAESLRDFNSAIIEEFRSNGGKVGGPFAGATLLLLTTTGAKSGRPRLAPLAYLNVDGMMIVVGSKAGADSNPDWVYNLRAHPQRRSRSAHRLMTASNRMRSSRGNCPPPNATTFMRKSPRWHLYSANTSRKPTGKYRFSN